MKCLIIPMLLIMLFTSCNLLLGEDPQDDPMSLLEYSLKLIETHYAGFQTKDINWDQLKDDSRTILAADPREDIFYNQLTNLIDQLNDGHIRLVTPEVEYNLFTKDNQFFNPRYVIDYYLQDPQNNVHKNLLYGSLNSQTAYLHIPTFSTSQNEQLEGIKDSAQWTEDFYTIIEEYLDTPYLIIDLRNNTGGDFTNGRALLQYFISQSSELTHNYRKNGPGPNDYYESVFQITPSSLHYSNQVILLVNKMTYSTSDILAIGLKELCGAHLIGISNRSETVGNPYPRELPNGWLLTLGSFNISVLGYVDGDMIDVDTQVWNTQESYNQKRDLQLEAALDWIAAQ